MELIQKLLDSFGELERCIEVTQEVLRGRDDVPADVLARVSQYSEMVAKQRGLAIQLHELIADQKWDEVNRSVKLINGFSQLIREDAQSILLMASGALPEYPGNRAEKLLA